MKAFFEDLNKEFPEITLLENQPMSAYTSFHIGGNAAILVLPKDENELVTLIRYARENGVCPRILGSGSNVLIPDEGIDALVIKPAIDGKIEISGNMLTADAGCLKAAAANAAAKAGLAGLEFAHGIPGTIGGGIRMNAGAYGGEMSQVTESVRALSPDGSIITLSRDDLSFSYRHSFFTENPDYTILSVKMRLSFDEPDAIRARMRELMARRRDKQPLEFPSAGSVFKRPEGYFAGKLIENAGLKGFSVGGAQVSEKHAGFIINRGGASADDVKRLISHIQKTVYAENGVELECEVEMW